jgi:predicted RNase H-like HicB family nuclease
MSRKKVKALEYNAIFQKEEEGGYSVWVPDLPGCASQGETLDEAMSNIEEAIALYLENEEERVYQTEARRQFMAPVNIRVHV